MNQALASVVAVNAHEHLLVSARDGDRQAFGELVRMHQRIVFSLALRMLNNRAMAEDLAQDVFLELYRKLHAIASLDHLKFWLRRVTAHRAIDRVRRQSVEDWTALADDEEEASVTHVDDPIWQRRVGRLIGELQPDARAVLLLRFQEDLDPADIARALDMPLNTVKSHLKRSLTTLRRKVHGDEPATDRAAEVRAYD